MTTNSDDYQTQIQAGPITQQTAKVQTNVHQQLSDDQLPAITQPHIKKRSRWTGFSDRTLWDWLQLLAALAIPLALVFGIIYFSYQRSQLVEVQHGYAVEAANTQYQHDVQTADDQQ